MTDYFISDTHFGHSHILELCNRPWDSVEKMDRDMIELWNARVGSADHVWHLGDFCFRAAEDPRRYLERLNGHIHLIIGNHDHKGVLRLPDLDKYFVSVDYAASISVADGRRAYLSHYPLAEPPKRVWSLYGHVHNNVDWPGFELVANQDLSLNCCADINGFMPVTFEELKVNNERWLRGSCAEGKLEN